LTRTTLDLDDDVLRALRERRNREHKPMGAIASELLARALHDDDDHEQPAELTWQAGRLGLRIDLEDKDALWAALDEP